MASTDLECMSRKDLQVLAKELGIKANLKVIPVHHDAT